LPSEQDVPLITGLKEQPLAGLHTSAVHDAPSTQTTLAPPTHTPAWHLSSRVQALPSLQDAPLPSGTNTHPLEGLHESAVQAMPSLQRSGVPAVQAPPWQLSPTVQAFPSVQPVPAGSGVNVQPLAGAQLSTVQGKPSAHVTALPGTHRPPSHASPEVHALPSEQKPPFGTGKNRHPAARLQVSVVQGSPSVHPTETPGLHAPAAHESPAVHGSPSVHCAPAGSGENTQPEAGLQLSVVHASPSVQVAGVTDRHVEPWQRSLMVQALPSEQGLPSGWGENTHPVLGRQLVATHGASLPQFSGAPAAQAPATHVSPTVQALPSEQAVEGAAGAKTQPVAGLHESTVQTLPSAQLTGAPGAQAPFWQASPLVHAEPSEHAEPFVTSVNIHPFTGSQVSRVQGFLSSQGNAGPGTQVPPWH
jgi:hypothetical protein